ncbi:VPLPA-CTERM sorting domain-containing protein [Massilia sp. SR12]
MKIATLLASALLSAAATAHAGVIDSTGHPGTIGNFGEPDTATYGQTFSLAGNHALNSFSLYLTGEVFAPVHFKAYVYEWNGAHATGAALYTSAAQSFGGAGPGSAKEFAFNTGSINLVDGKSYVAFLSTTGLFDGVLSTARMPTAPNDAIATGSFVYMNNVNNFDWLTNTRWESRSHDVWFKASYDAGNAADVPLPATLPLLGAGLLALGLVRRRKA